MNTKRQLLIGFAASALLSGLGEDALALARWQFFGADPAYDTRPQAVADVENVLANRKVNWRRSVRRAFAARMRAGKGEIRRIVIGDRFDFMRTGKKGEIWTEVVADFKQKPKEPGTDFSVRAEYWVHIEDGVTYELYLPETCNNIAGRKTGVMRATKACAYVLFEARENDAYAIVHILEKAPVHDEDCEVSVSGPKPDRNSFDQKEFEPLADLVTGRCPTDRIPAYYGLPLRMVGSFQVTPGWYAVKVPLVFADNLDTRVVICLVNKQGISTYAMGVQHFEYHVQPSGRKVAVIWYSKEEVRADYVDKTGLWWRWSNQLASCR